MHFRCFHFQFPLVSFVGCVLLGFATASPAQETPAKIRVGFLAAGEAWAAALELAETGLVGVESLELLERSRMEEVLREQGLQAAGLTEAQTLHMGRLLRADGLMRIESLPEGGAILTLNGTRTEAVLAAERIPEPGQKPEQAAARIEAFLLRNLPLLRIPEGQMRALTLLPLRLGISQIDTLRLEKEMTRRLAERLVASGSIAVLDRERADDFLMDRYFTQGATGTFWKSGAVLELRGVPVAGSPGQVRFEAELRTGAGAPQALKGNDVPLSTWEQGIDAMATELVAVLVASGGAGEGESHRLETRSLSALAMRLYPYDLPRAIQVADLAFAMGDRSRDVLIIRTQTQLQELFLEDPKPHLPILKGIPPVLINLGFYMQFKEKYGNEIPVEVLERMYHVLIGMQRDILGGAEQWQSENRGWIALKTAMLHGGAMQYKARSHRQWERLRPLARENASVLREGIQWLKEHKEWSNLFLVESLENMPHLLWETPEQVMEVQGHSFRQAKKFDPLALDKLSVLAGHSQRKNKDGTSTPPTELRPYVPEEWATARRAFFAGLAEGKTPAETTYFLHAATHWPELRPEGWTAPRVWDALFDASKAALSAGQEYDAFAHLRGLAQRMEEELPGRYEPMVLALIAHAIEIYHTRWPLGTNIDYMRGEEAAACVHFVYSAYRGDVWNRIPEEARLRLLRELARKRNQNDHGNSSVVYASARDWLVVLGHPPEDLSRADVDTKVYIPKGEAEGEGYKAQPGHIVDVMGRRSFKLNSLGLTWAWNHSTLRLTGWDPDGIAPGVDFQLPKAETPADVLYYHSLRPLEVGDDWVLFRSEFPMVGRGRLAGFRRSEALRREYFIHGEDTQERFHLYKGHTTWEFGGHIAGDLYLYSPGIFGQATPGVRRLDLMSGDETTIQLKGNAGPFPHAKNPPKDGGFWMRWGDSSGALVSMNFDKKKKTHTMRVHRYAAETGEWSSETWDADTLARAGLTGDDMTLRPGPGETLRVGDGRIDLKVGGLPSADASRRVKPVWNSDGLAWTIPGAESAWIVGRAMRTEFDVQGETLVEFQKDKQQPFELLSPTADRDEALRRGEAALRAALEPKEAEAVGRDMQAALYWFRRAEALGDPRAAGILANLLQAQLPVGEPMVLNGALTPPWAWKARQQGDAWGLWAAALVTEREAGVGRLPFWPENRMELARKAAEAGIVPALRYVAQAHSGPGILAKEKQDTILAYVAARAYHDIQAAKASDPQPIHLLEHMYARLQILRGGITGPLPAVPDPNKLLEAMPPEQRTAAETFAKTYVPAAVARWQENRK